MILPSLAVTIAPHRAIEAINRADAHAPFLRLLLRQMPLLAEALARGEIGGGPTSDDDQSSDMPVSRQLRRQRQALALRLAIGDLAGALSLEQVTGALSAFADHALDRAITTALAERTPGEPPRGFAALALGKHGGGELNYSSDIDPILIFDPETLPLRSREVAEEAAVRIARRVVELLQARDADGYVFRVDLRLRPSPEVTPIALPVDAAIAYYESSALPWERAAFIRARACAGDVALGGRFLEAIRPFIWRRSLDFGAINEIQGISSRIRDHHAQGQRLGPGYDLKRGRGGIREVEFFTQIHQLIHGGRDPALRARPTLAALQALAAAGKVAGEDLATLADAYRLLRTIEHRLQMVEDQQTHRLPVDAAALDNVARLHGAPDGAALLGLLREPVAAVGAVYDRLGATGHPGLPHDPDALEAALRDAGFPDPIHARRRIDAWRMGGVGARSGAAAAALEAMLPQLAAAFGRAADPASAINRFDDMLRRLPAAVSLFRLLEAQPDLAALTAEILCHAPVLADELGRRPALLDGLIDASAFDDLPAVDVLARRFSSGEHGDDYQALLDRVRLQVGEARFALGVQIIKAAADPLAVTAGYARVAEAAVTTLTDATIASFEAAHGRVPGGEFVILALGRFGGAALTHASDLDLIYLFTGAHTGESDGAKPLGATHYFNRLAQRVTAALSVQTAAGPLYQIDTRLRPSGAKGLLAASFDSFARYHADEAWTWERMALTRARPVYGSRAARAALSAIIDETLRRRRDPESTIADAVAMRSDMAAHKPARGPLDVKFGDGGLVDLEFAVHTTQLTHRLGFDPELGAAIGGLVAAGLLPPALAPAHDLLTRLLVTLRLIAPDGQAPAEPSLSLVARACGMPDWQTLLVALDEARQSVATTWAAIAARH